jgi:protocatechuate 3,4-dioxygenase beta subunit
MGRPRSPRAAAAIVVLITATALHGQTVPPPASAPRPGLPPRDASRPPATGTAKIRGRVISPETGAPLRRALVSIVSLEGGIRRVVTADADGRYEFADLPEGRYNLTASKGGFVTLQYGQRRPFEPGRPVNVVDEQVLERVDFTLPRGSVIAGRVSDEFGEPITGVQVQAQRYMYLPGGQRRLTYATAPGSTDDLGQFRIFGLMPGEYIVSTTSRGGLTFQQGASGSTDSFEGYAPTYYPGTPNPAEAQPVSVSLGQELSMNFSLKAARMARISGTVVDSRGRPTTGAYVTLFSRAGGGISAMSNGSVAADGAFTLINVAPGEQTLEVSANPRTPDDQQEFASVPLTMTGENLTGLRITTSPGATIGGTVVFEGTSPRTGAPTPRVVVQSAMPSEPGRIFFNADSSNGLIAEDGTFAIKGVSPQAVLFRTVTPQTWVLKSVTMNGDEIIDVPTQISESAKVNALRIVLTDRVTDLSGTVVGNRDEPLKDYVVVVHPAEEKDGAAIMRYVRTARPDQDGRFRIRGLPPGRYVAAAVEALEQGREWDPEFVRRIRDVATRFTLGEGQTLTLSLTVANAP